MPDPGPWCPLVCRRERPGQRDTGEAPQTGSDARCSLDHRPPPSRGRVCERKEWPVLTAPGSNAHLRGIRHTGLVPRRLKIPSWHIVCPEREAGGAGCRHEPPTRKHKHLARCPLVCLGHAQARRAQASACGARDPAVLTEPGTPHPPPGRLPSGHRVCLGPDSSHFRANPSGPGVQTEKVVTHPDGPRSHHFLRSTCLSAAPRVGPGLSPRGLSLPFFLGMRLAKRVE